MSAGDVPPVDAALIAGALLNSASDAIVATDREGLIVHWSPGAERMFGYAESEAVGQSLDIIVPEAQRQRHWDGFHHAMASGTSRYGAGDLLAVPALTKAGTRISIEFTIDMLRAPDGTTIGTVAVIRDVTRQFEEMRRLRKLATVPGETPSGGTR